MIHSAQGWALPLHLGSSWAESAESQKVAFLNLKDCCQLHPSDSRPLAHPLADCQLESLEYQIGCHLADALHEDLASTEGLEHSLIEHVGLET